MYCSVRTLPSGGLEHRNLSRNNPHTPLCQGGNNTSNNDQNNCSNSPVRVLIVITQISPVLWTDYSPRPPIIALLSLFLLSSTSSFSFSLSLFFLSPIPPSLSLSLTSLLTSLSLLYLSTSSQLNPLETVLLFSSLYFFSPSPFPHCFASFFFAFFFFAHTNPPKRAFH